MSVKDHMKNAAGAMAILVIFILAIGEAESQEVKYCIDLRTQEVVAVPANMPCPFPTTEL